MNSKNEKEQTALHISVIHENNNLDFVYFLLYEGAIVNAVDHMGNTSLHYASERGNMYIVELLVDNRADINIVNKDKENVLHLAVNQSEPSKEILIYLITKGVDVNGENCNGRTPLLYAAKWEHLFTSKVLIKNRANVNHVYKNGQTALHLAVNQKQPNQRLIMYQLRNGAGVNRVDENGKSCCRVGTYFKHKKFSSKWI